MRIGERRFDDVRCERCGEQLDYDFVERDGVPVMRVAPCGTCCNAALEEGMVQMQQEVITAMQRWGVKEGDKGYGYLSGTGRKAPEQVCRDGNV